jgi:hypothetical protein
MVVSVCTEKSRIFCARNSVKFCTVETDVVALQALLALWDVILMGVQDFV